MRKIYPYRQGIIYAWIFQIIWQYKKNFHKAIEGIISHYFPYLITFWKVLWIDFYESNQKFSESA